MNYRFLLEMFLLFIIGICTVTDYLYRKIWLPVLMAAIPIILLCIIGMEGKVVDHIICGMLCWVVFWGISIATGGQIEKGDGVILGIMGFALGVWQYMAFLFLSFFYAFLAAIFLVVVKKKKRNYKMPFVPFVLIGYLTLSLIGRMG